MPIPSKGLRSSVPQRTRRAKALPAYSVYLRIACIEMEKGRRALERRAAEGRIAKVARRVAELEREKAALTATLGDAAPDVAAESTETPSLPAPGGFPIRY